MSKVLRPFSKEIKLIPGRETSPVLYVLGELAVLEKILTKRHRADEKDIYKMGYDWYEDYLKAPFKKIHIPGPVLRLWWD